MTAVTTAVTTTTTTIIIIIIIIIVIIIIIIIIINTDLPNVTVFLCVTVELALGEVPTDAAKAEDASRSEKL